MRRARHAPRILIAQGAAAVIFPAAVGNSAQRGAAAVSWTRALDRPYGNADPADTRPAVYDAGTLFVDLVDARTGAVVWRGWAEGSLDGAIDDQVWLEARVDEAVRRIMQRLPAPR